MVKILMAVDGSDHDTKTAQLLGGLFQGAPQVEVTVLHVANSVLPTPAVLEMGMVPMIPSPQEMDRWQREIRAQAEESVAQAAAAVQRAGLQARTQVAWGNPAEVIVKVAEEGAYNLIALGSRGAGQVAGIFLGSVSDRVVHRARTPVLVVR